MSTDLPSEENEWRLYFCLVSELWQAVRDRQPSYIVEGLLEEIEALSFTTNQDLLYRRCERILGLTRPQSGSNPCL